MTEKKASTVSVQVPQAYRKWVSFPEAYENEDALQVEVSLEQEVKTINLPNDPDFVRGFFIVAIGDSRRHLISDKAEIKPLKINLFDLKVSADVDVSKVIEEVNKKFKSEAEKHEGYVMFTISDGKLAQVEPFSSHQTILGFMHGINWFKLDPAKNGIYSLYHNKEKVLNVAKYVHDICKQ